MYATWPVTAVTVVVAVTAFLVRLSIALRGGGPGGSFGYDDGVYYGASTALLWGRVPYQDFVLLHPPGIMVVLAPFALLGRLTHDALGFEAARVLSMLVGSLNTVLVVRICRRSGLAAAGAGGLVYALWTPAVLSETTTRLEPWVSLGLLLALAILAHRPGLPSPRALVWAGAALGLAVSVKIWAVAPGVLVLVWVWRRWGAPALGRTALGVVAAGCLLDLPFLLAAPGQMLRMVVLDQLGRGRTSAGPAARVARTLLSGASLSPDWTPGPLPAVVAAGVLAAVVLTCGRTRRGRFALSLLGLEVAVLVLSPSFFSYYPAFAAPGVALVAASAVAGLDDRRRRPSWRPVRLGRELVSLTLAVVVSLALLGTTLIDSRAVVSLPFPAADLAASAATSRCVTSDSPDALILTDVFGRDLRRGCRVPIDLTGISYDTAAPRTLPDGTREPRRRNARWQRDLAAYLFSGQTVFILRSRSDGFATAVARRIATYPVLGRGPGYLLLRDPSRRAVAGRTPAAGAGGRPTGGRASGGQANTR